MPCLRQGDFKMVESGAIVEHLEKTHPNPSLTIEGMSESVQVQSTFFPALAKFIKSPNHQADLEKSLMEQLKKLNTHLDEHKTKYFAGDEPSLVDFNLAPKLYHMDVTLEKFYPKTHEKALKMAALKKYMDTIFNEDAFKNCSCPRETVVWGWSAARK